MNELKDVSMKNYTSFRAGGNVRRLVIVDDVRELKDVLMDVTQREEEKPWVFLGNGSNTLFACPEYEGTVIKLGEGFDYIEIRRPLKEKDKAVTVKVGGACLLSRLAKAVAGEGLTGLEFAAGIPGSVGGAVFMNAGAYGGEIKDVFKEAKILSTNPRKEGWEVVTISGDKMDFKYRGSRLQKTKEILIEATFELMPGNKDAIIATMKDLAERRTSKQPLEFPSAGSFFKRPRPLADGTELYAGKLIEDSGLKGFSVGDAQVSEKHAGFVINKGEATPEDILKLKEFVQKKVKEDSGVMLEPEIRIIT